jgi:hypothetical protein
MNDADFLAKLLGRPRTSREVLEAAQDRFAKGLLDPSGNVATDAEVDLFQARLLGQKPIPGKSAGSRRDLAEGEDGRRTVRIVESIESDCELDARRFAIRGVKLVGPKSYNRRDYPRSVLAAARSLYEKAAVFAGHANHPGSVPECVRKIGYGQGERPKIGVVCNVSMSESGSLIGDLALDPHSIYARAVMMEAMRSPGSFGLSHSVVGRISRGESGRDIVEKITSVRSVDLVTDPATTSGLFT